jgi:hypothetical protein
MTLSATTVMVLITQVLQGEYKVVYPPTAAETKPVVPTPPWDKR